MPQLVCHLPAQIKPNSRSLLIGMTIVACVALFKNTWQILGFDSYSGILYCNKKPLFFLCSFYCNNPLRCIFYGI